MSPPDEPAQVGSTASAWISARRDALAERIVERHFAQRPGLEQRWGAAARTRCREDTVFHLLYLCEALRFDAPGLFTEYARWAADLLAALDIPCAALAEHFDTLADVVCEEIEPGAREVVRRVATAGREEAGRASAAPPPQIDESSPHAALARDYLDALLRRDKVGALRLVLEAAERVSISDLYLEVFQPVLREVGRLWQTNRLSVAGEHFCTAVTQLAMARIYARIPPPGPGGPRVVVAGVGDELHDVGAHMVSDLLELDGFRCAYLGTDLPARDVVGFALQEGARVLAVSATVPTHLGRVAELVGELRGTRSAEELPILVGGRAFAGAPSRWRAVGADAVAEDALRAVEAVRSLVAPASARGAAP